MVAHHLLEKIQQLLWTSIAAQLKRVKEDSEVIFKGKRYTVSTTTKEPMYKNYKEWYLLVPETGGKPIKVDWFDLAVDLRKKY